MKKQLLIISFICIAANLFSAPVSEMIIVDQIGYRTASAKWFMIKNPITGYDSAITYVPGASVQLRRSSDSAVMQTITLSSWNGGAEDTTFSGDIVWQGNFTSFTTPGIYHIYDPTNDRQSYNFEIGDNIYNGALAASLKSYFYNRSNIAITAAHGGVWTHALDHTQQLTARLYDASLGGIQTGTERDITKGWFDAGDYRKYTSWMAPVIWDLAYAYEWYPDRFSDASNIPESGNGVPDILDEIKWELDWMLKMQETNSASPRFGALYSGCFVVTGINGTGNGIGDPSTENRPYFYANYSTAATASGAAAFAIGARLFAAYTSAYPGYSTQLLTAAERAWAFLQANTSNIQYNHTNFDNANANQGTSGDNQLRFMAAAELYRATGTASYRTYCDANYNHANTTDGTHQPILNNYFETGASSTMQRGLVSYCFASGATAATVNNIKTSIRNGIEWNITANNNNCPYKAFMWAGHYTWGSNAMKAGWGNVVQYGIQLNVNAAQLAAYQAVAEEYLHYYHGRNATSFSYLTQSQLFGADKSITQIYHGWFHQGTSFDTNPAPGFLAGGPNQYFAPDGSYGGTIAPPQNQPPMKSYKDWNTSWPENSWEVTENSTGYQSRHVLLNAAFAGPAGPTPTHTITATNTPYLGTPTFTPTRTRTPTITLTSTNTPVPCGVINYDGETGTTNLASGGAWIDPVGGSVTETTAQAHTGTRSMMINFVWASGWYSGMGWNWTSWNAAGDVYDASGDISLEFWVRTAAGTNTNLGFSLVDTAGNGSNNVSITSYLVSGATTTWQKVEIPLADFTGASLNALWEIRINTGGAVSGNQTIYFDDFVFNRPCANTPTNTPVMSPTFTATRTNTMLPSATRTITPSHSMTSTSTPTRTPSATNTAADSPTSTPTSTPTRTPTNVISPTLTGTSTSTSTPTSVVSPTFTPTSTYTATGTFTATSTSTFTATNTYSSTGTRTFTPTITPTFTITESHTVTPTETPYAGTPTETYTPTVTNTAQDTHTSTATATATNTATQSMTQTFTNTSTPTHSYTAVSSPTFTPTNTNTAENPTFTITQTLTSTPVNTQTFTATQTVTRTATQSATRTSTSTATRTPTVTRTPTPGATATPTTIPDAQILIVNYASAAPNPIIKPSASTLLRVDFRVSKSCSSVKLSIYTASFRKIASAALSGSRPAGEGHADAAIPGIENMSSGVYYGVVEASGTAGEKALSRPFIILIIR